MRVAVAALLLLLLATGFVALFGLRSSSGSPLATGPVAPGSLALEVAVDGADPEPVQVVYLALEDELARLAGLGPVGFLSGTNHAGWLLGGRGTAWFQGDLPAGLDPTALEGSVAGILERELGVDAPESRALLVTRGAAPDAPTRRRELTWGASGPRWVDVDG